MADKINQVKAAIADATGVLQAGMSDKGIVGTSSAIAAVGVLASINKPYATVLLDNAIDNALILAREKLSEANTKAYIGEATLRQQASKRPSSQLKYDEFPNQDALDKNDTPFLGVIADEAKVQGSIIFGDTPINQQPITWIDNNGATQTLPKIAVMVAIVTATPSKNIVKTSVNGRDGSIKEYIGMNDVDINIECEVNFQFGQARVDIMRQLDLMYQCPFAIPVTNYYLNALGVTNIVIENMPYVQKKGEYSNLYFTIKASQDLPIAELLPQ